MTETMKDRAKRLEAYTTPEWAIRAILDKELLTQHVFDPCAGTGIIRDILEEKGYDVEEYDIYPWNENIPVGDWLNPGPFVTFDLYNSTLFMNPPFSKACKFVEKGFERGLRKIVSFQRFTWYEGKSRRQFWENHPPSRVYICGDRASCWRFDVEDKDKRNGTSTTHAWYVWERGNPAGTQLGHIYKK